jgi:hypothetical protein
LRTHISSSHLKGLPSHDAKRLSRDMCSGLKYIDQKSVLHCNLKSSNVLLQMADGQPLAAMIVDFGEARLAVGSPLTPDVVTIWYRAPEIWYHTIGTAVMLMCGRWAAPLWRWSMACRRSAQHRRSACCFCNFLHLRDPIEWSMAVVARLIQTASGSLGGPAGGFIQRAVFEAVGRCTWRAHAMLRFVITAICSREEAICRNGSAASLVRLTKD